MKYARILIGAIISPLLTALVVSLPSFGTAAFVQSAIVSFVICLILFLSLGAISHVILKWKQWHALRQYLGVMFSVASVILFIVYISLFLWIFGNGGSEFHLGTQVIEDGHLTLGGVLLTMLEAMCSAVWVTASFALFWFIAVRNKGGGNTMPNKQLKERGVKESRAL